MSEKILGSGQVQRMLKADEVADILSISKAMVYKLMQTGDIRTVRIASARRVRQEDLAAFIENRLTKKSDRV